MKKKQIKISVECARAKGSLVYKTNLRFLLRELSAKLTEGLYFFEFLPFYNPSASHLLGTSLYTREA